MDYRDVKVKGLFAEHFFLFLGEALEGSLVLSNLELGVRARVMASEGVLAHEAEVAFILESVPGYKVVLYSGLLLFDSS